MGNSNQSQELLDGRKERVPDDVNYGMAQQPAPSDGNSPIVAWRLVGRRGWRRGGRHRAMERRWSTFPTATIFKCIVTEYGRHGKFCYC